MKKILVVGAGNVGAHIIHAGITQNVRAEFYLLDINEELERSQVLDLKDTLLFSEYSRIEGISSNDPIIHEIDVVVITAGANQMPGETRCDLLQKNKGILQSIAGGLTELKPSAVVVIVTNPVDILTRLAYECFDLPQNQIIGTGTLLDSARLRWRISEEVGINVQNIHGYVLGEHGDSEFVAWSTVHPKHDFSSKKREDIQESVKNAAYDIIEGKGATYFGISNATTKILKAILNDTKEVIPVSAVYPHRDQECFANTALGIPAVIGKSGIESVPEIQLDDDEWEKLESSAKKLHDLYQTCPI